MTDGNVEIRQATKADFDAIIEMCKSSLQVTYGSFLDEEDMKPWSEGDEIDKYVRSALGNLLVAVDCDGISGVAGVEGDLIGLLWVAIEKRGEGIGADLIEAAEEMIRKNGHKKVRVEVFEPNTDAIRFYERHGWAKREAYPDPTAGVNKVLMVKQ